MAAVRCLKALRRCQRHFLCSAPAGQTVVVESARPVLALVGIVRPRIFISRPVLQALSPDQLAAALRHEEAHRSARDNLKRLLFLLAPAVFPCLDLFGPLEKAWARFSEWAADDESVDGDPQRALSLAAALVQFARMGASGVRVPLSQLLPERDDFALRVERLLAAPPAPCASALKLPLMLVLLLPLLLALGPVLLQPAHHLVELLMR